MVNQEKYFHLPFAIFHLPLTFMDITIEIKDKLQEKWLPEIYRQEIRPLRTRAFRLDVDARENKTEIQHTLLGVELKVGNKRIACPDLSTARYLQVFASLGCSEIAVPYDITKISHLADELESSRQKILLVFEDLAEEKKISAKNRQRSNLVKEIRKELDEIGAGELMPQFKQTTKQRSD